MSRTSVQCVHVEVQGAAVRNMYGHPHSLAHAATSKSAQVWTTNGHMSKTLLRGIMKSSSQHNTCGILKNGVHRVRPSNRIPPKIRGTLVAYHFNFNLSRLPQTGSSATHVFCCVRRVCVLSSTVHCCSCLTCFFSACAALGPYLWDPSVGFKNLKISN